MKVFFEPTAKKALDEIMKGDKKTGNRILVRLNDLQYDPYPDSVTTDSEAVQFLKKQGIDIRKLHCDQFHKYRIFYFVDNDRDRVIICEIILRSKDTYDRNTPHITRMIQAYKKHFNIK